MTTFTATFSTGKTIRRTSAHPYKCAVALVHKTTGQIINIKFTSANSRTAKPDWKGFRMVSWGYGLSQEGADRINARTMAERENWTVEIVEVQS